MDEQDADEDEAGTGEIVADPGYGRQAVLGATETVRGGRAAKAPPTGRSPTHRATCPDPFPAPPWLQLIIFLKKHPYTASLTSLCCCYIIVNKPFSFVSVLQILFYIQRQSLPFPYPAQVSDFISQVPENPIAQVSSGVAVTGTTGGSVLTPN